jgi:DNA-binding transcriptional MerR regulator
MRDLVAATGAPKSTILFYLAQGLLPQPQRTGTNTAVYDSACVERIRFIRQLQTRHRLTLSEIRDRLDGGVPAGDIAPPRLDEAVFEPPTAGERLGGQAFCRATGLTPRRVDELVRAGLLQPVSEDGFDPDDVEMGRMYRGAFDDGVRLGDLAFYVDLGEAIVAQEMALRDRMIGHRPAAEDASAMARVVRCTRMCRAYVVDRLFQRRLTDRKAPSSEAPPEREPEREPWID